MNLSMSPFAIDSSINDFAFFAKASAVSLNDDFPADDGSSGATAGSYFSSVLGVVAGAVGPIGEAGAAGAVGLIGEEEEP